MALSRRTGQRFQNSIWPGFVDAMTGLLLVLMFVLTFFMVVQFVLRETISGQEDELNQLAGEVAALAQALGLEENRAADLDARVNTLPRTQGDAQAQLGSAAAARVVKAGVRCAQRARRRALRVLRVECTDAHRRRCVGFPVRMNVNVAFTATTFAIHRDFDVAVCIERGRLVEAADGVAAIATRRVTAPIRNRGSVAAKRGVHVHQSNVVDVVPEDGAVTAKRPANKRFGREHFVDHRLGDVVDLVEASKFFDRRHDAAQIQRKTAQVGVFVLRGLVRLADQTVVRQSLRPGQRRQEHKGGDKTLHHSSPTKNPAAFQPSTCSMRAAGRGSGAPRGINPARRLYKISSTFCAQASYVSRRLAPVPDSSPWHVMQCSSKRGCTLSVHVGGGPAKREKRSSACASVPSE